MTPRTPEQKRRAKYNAVQLRAGRPALMSNQETHLHVCELHDVHGMALTRIAELANTSIGVVHNIYRRNTTRIFRTTHDRIMQVQPEVPYQCGAFRHPCGVERRINALTLEGFPMSWLTDHIGLAKTNLERYVQHDRTWAHASTLRRVTEVYDKYIGTDPQDQGIDRKASQVSQHYAHKRHAVPWHCWDDDSIDNPDAEPEWTGSCGTTAGRLIHYRDGIPICRRCSVAHQIYRRYPHLAQLMGVVGELKNGIQAQ